MKAKTAAPLQKRDLPQLAKELSEVHGDLVYAKMGLNGLRGMKHAVNAHNIDPDSDYFEEKWAKADAFVTLLELTARLASEAIDRVEKLQGELQDFAGAAA
jgi:hypothetical protein